MTEQTKPENSIVSFIKLILFCISFSFELTFGNKIAMMLWAIVFLSLIYLLGFYNAVFIPGLYSFGVVFAGTIMILGFGYVVSRSRDP